MPDPISQSGDGIWHEWDRESSLHAYLDLHRSGEHSALKLPDHSFLIGRSAKSDLVLPEAFVSSQHLRIEPRGQNHMLTDLGSTNGTRLGRRLLKPERPVLLHHGETIRISDPVSGETIVIMYRRDGRSSLSRRFPLLEAVSTIGRATNTITLDDPQLSRQHAQIEVNGSRVLLRDLGSSAGSFINGVQVTLQELKHADIVQLGSSKLRFIVTDGAYFLDEYADQGALRLDAYDLSYAIMRNRRRRTILRDIDLSVAARSLMAIVGPSGAGKSTLLKLLSDAIPATTGRLLVDGNLVTHGNIAYRRLIGYVPQEDIVHRQLTVAEALSYTAQLRLAPDISADELRWRIDRALSEVELSDCRDQLIDSLSGGQRKRVCIASELLADPAIFFLDEPSAGLDPGLERRLIETLRRLADTGRTIILATHATASVMQCDTVSFLARGRLVYTGPPIQATTFFGVDQADFAAIYTALNGRATPEDADSWTIVEDELQEAYASWQTQRGERGAGSGPYLAELWALKYRRSHEQPHVRAALAEAQPLQETSPRITPRLSAFRQFRVLLRRQARLLLRDKRNLGMLLAQAPLVGLLIAIVARADAVIGEAAAASEAKKVLFMLATVAVWFGVINAAREIIKEAAIYQRERQAGLGILPYVLSKATTLSVLVLIQSAFLLLMVLLRVDFPTMGTMLPLPLELYITTVLTGMAGLATGLSISALATSSDSPDRAMALVPFALIPQILFAGVIFRLGEELSLQRMLSWLTISRWSMDAYGASAHINELPLMPGALRPIEPAAEYLTTPEHVLSRWLILVLITLLGLAVTAGLLRWRDRRG